MKNVHLISTSLIAMAALLSNGLAHAGGDDNPLLAKFMLDEFERGVESNDSTNFEAQAWIGKDLDKLWLKAEGGYKNSDEKALELQALYSRAIAPFWDAQIGLRVDTEPSPSRKWAVLGLQGLAPYHFDIDAALFIGEKGRTAVRLNADYDLLITQKLILSPEVEVNFYGKNDAELGIGSGLSDISTALRLRYEIIREFAPYIGIERSQKFGKTSDFASNAGFKTNETQVVVGLRLWF